MVINIDDQVCLVESVEGVKAWLALLGEEILPA